MIEQGKVIYVVIFLLISIYIQHIIRSFYKGDGAMRKIVGTSLEVLQAFNISLVAGATLSLR